MNNFRQPNYSAWDFQIKDFFACSSDEEKIAFLVKFAVLAPSSHNSQPWQFKLIQNKIFLKGDPSRELSKSDQRKRQEFISIGAALENLLIAADYFGYKTAVEYLQNDIFETTIEVTFEKITEAKEDVNHLIHTILRRTTNRNNYDNKKDVDKMIISKIQNIPKFFSNISFDIINDSQKKSLLTETIVLATKEAMRGRDFRRELAKYILPTKTHSSVGMPGDTIGVPFFFSYLLPLLIRISPPPEKQSRELHSQLLLHTPFFGILSSTGDTTADWIDTGRTFGYITLTAEKHGLATHPLAAVIEMNDYRKILMKEVTKNFLPQFFFRLGYPTKNSPHSPRLKNIEVIV